MTLWFTKDHISELSTISIDNENDDYSDKRKSRKKTSTNG